MLPGPHNNRAFTRRLRAVGFGTLPGLVGGVRVARRAPGAVRVEPVEDGVADGAELVDLFRRQRVEQLLPDRLDVARRGGDDRGVSGVGERRDVAALVGAALLAPHPARLLQPRHRVREPAQRGVGDLGELRRSEEHTSELQSQSNLVCRLLLEKKKKKKMRATDKSKIKTKQKLLY